MANRALYSSRYVSILAALFAVEWAALAIAPRHRQDWLLENAIVIIAICLLALFRRRLALSNDSYTMVFLFLTLHEVGAHYTYAEVPYEAWAQTLTGRSLDALLGWQRNNFDRVVHFCFGLMLALPVWESTRRLTRESRAWSWVVPITLLTTCSTLYELIEWGAAMVFGGELGMAYLGTQGDIWDAHKDMAMAGLGALIGVSLASRPRRR